MASEKQTDSLRTSGQKYKRRQSNRMYVGKDVVRSLAFRRLTATAHVVYMIFLTKRQVKPYEGTKGRRMGKGEYYIANNGEIQFTYKDAEEKWGISRKAFRDALDLLIEVGLIDITQSGLGLCKDCSLYALSERWKEYGTENFIEMKRPKSRHGFGFKKGNRCGKYSKKKYSQVYESTPDQVYERALVGR